MSAPPDPPTQSLVTDEAGRKLRSRKLRVEVTAGPQAGRVAELPGPEARVGSAEGCDLALDDPTVSRHHLTLRIDANGVRVIDEGSRNGTTVDGLRIRDAYARPDSNIALGNSALALRLLDDVIELPLSSKDRFGSLLGRSVAMRRLFAILERIAPTETTVLVEGETGTGKELVAEAIHEESARSAGPFVVFDCSAISANLIESELFGHVRGAFTGAVAERMGAFEAADGGTLFLDEIGELPLDLQPKLLRALERREVRRIGQNAPRTVDVRIVAATNRTLASEVERGAFREDLFYRLDVVRVALPPLRERAEDIPLLVDHFAKQLSKSGAPAELPRATVRGFQTQAWPGNVRELRNAVARAVSLGAAAAGGESSAAPANEDPAALSAPVVDLAVPLKLAVERHVDVLERAYITEALKQTGGNVSRAADLLGCNRKLIQRALRRFGLRDET
ncbi:MAG TPA: sigma 54-interacting transcriptional regulator [Polyangia bacterium]|nr:sigma 54-interacting transcriptional regulator [Polyangia bacterium]